MAFRVHRPGRPVLVWFLNRVVNGRRASMTAHPELDAEVIQALQLVCEAKTIPVELWALLFKFVADRLGTRIDPGDFAREIEKPRYFALAMFMAFEAVGIGKLYHEVFHTCRNSPIGARLLREGFQPVPLECPWCAQTVKSQRELSYRTFYLTRDLRMPVQPMTTPSSTAPQKKRGVSAREQTAKRGRTRSKLTVL